MKSCRYHCGGCGLHFSSLRLFDAHRVGAKDRHCSSPDAQIEGLVQIPGICRAYEEKECLIWADPQAAERLRGVFAGSTKAQR